MAKQGGGSFRRLVPFLLERGQQPRLCEALVSIHLGLAAS
jgi:hypothetical protein